MPKYLRRFRAQDFRHGLLSGKTFFCRGGSLSYYIRSAPIDLDEGAKDMCDFFCQSTNAALGIFELGDEDLSKFGLFPTAQQDADDDKYGQLHHESKCFEEIYLIDEPKLKDASEKVMNRKKDLLAAIAQDRIIVAPVHPNQSADEINAKE